jgi:hypothetical protein
MSRGRVQGPKRKKHRLDLLVVNWSHIVGERLAAHSAPTRLIRGTLTVAADSPAWAAELSMATDSLLRKIGGLMGDQAVRRVRVQSRERAPEGDQENADAGAAGEGRESLEVSGKLSEDIGALEDEDMRKALARLVRASSTTRQSEHKED